MMRYLYNIAFCMFDKLLAFSSVFLKDGSRSKYSLFVKGHKDIIAGIEEDMRLKDACLPTYWLHASSLGEFAVARPIIRRLRQRGRCNIVVTFFSSTGYEALKENHEGIDYLYYLPLDTADNARRFVDAVRPDKALFIISEYWFNYLYALKERNIPTYLVSALVGDKRYMSGWYWTAFRNVFKVYTHIFVLDAKSEASLRRCGVSRVSVSGDPLFDNARVISETPWHDAVIERFACHGDIFVAGSISDSKDLGLMCRLANKHRDTRFIFVPHEICEEGLDKIKYGLEGHTLLYSECDGFTDFSSVQVLVIDFLGALAYLYRYAKWAYIGGGFTPLLHSVIEATVYGIPVSFGPEIHRKVTPNQLMELGIGRKVTCFRELDSWFSALKYDDGQLERIRLTAADYVARNLNATEQIVRFITEKQAE